MLGSSPLFVGVGYRLGSVSVMTLLRSDARNLARRPEDVEPAVRPQGRSFEGLTAMTGFPLMAWTVTAGSRGDSRNGASVEDVDALFRSTFHACRMNLHPVISMPTLSAECQQPCQ